MLFRSKYIEVRNLKKYFGTRRGLLHAVDDVSFDIGRGETLGLVGESGCGKSTLGRTLIRLLDATAGQVLFDGVDLLKLGSREMKEMRKKVQIVFQDPYSCLNPRLSVWELIAEPLIVNSVYRSKSQCPRPLQDPAGLSGIEGEGLLHENGFARLKGEHRLLGVEGVRGRDVDGLDGLVAVDRKSVV